MKSLLAPVLAVHVMSIPVSVEPAKGVFLVAKSSIDGGPFYQSVVLLLAHDEDGTLGVIVNRRTEIPIVKAVPELNLSESSYEFFFGGPVGLDGLFFVFRSDVPRDNVEFVIKGVYFSGDRSLLDSLIDNDVKDSEIHFFLGHSGWVPGQLDVEILRGDWHLLHADIFTIFEKDPSKMWKELSKKKGLRASTL